MTVKKKQVEILKDTTVVTGALLDALVSGGDQDVLHVHTTAYTHFYTTGNLTTDIATIGATPATLYIDVATDLGGSATIPSTLKLKFENEGIITIDAGETLIILGAIEAGFYQIFNAVHDTTSIVKFGDETIPPTFFALSPVVIHPEWWGAAGDRIADDWKPLQQMFNVPSRYGTQLIKIVFPPGKNYLFKSSLKIGAKPPTLLGTWNTTFSIEGNGSWLWGSLADIGANPVIEIGHIEDWLGPNYYNAQVYWLHWSFLNVATIGARVYGTILVQISSCQFSTFEHCVWGGLVDVVVGTHPDQIGGNSNAFMDVNLAGGTTNLFIGNTIQANNWRFIGGRVQQCDVAIRIEGAGFFYIEGIDISVTNFTAMEIIRSSGSLKNVYSEGIQLTPIGGYQNTGAVFYLEDCNLVSIEDCGVNGGGGSLASDTGYGIYITGNSNAIRISGCSFVRHTIADVFAGPDTSQIFVDGDNVYTSNFSDLPEISISDPGKNIINEIAQVSVNSNYYSPWHGNQKNYIQAPYDFSDPNWTLSFATINGTTIAPDGISLAQIIEFPNTAYAGDTNPASVSTMKNTYPIVLNDSIDNQTIVLQYWVKGIDLINLAIIIPDNQLTSFQTIIVRDGGESSNVSGRDVVCSLDGYYDGYSEWAFVKHEYAPPVPGTSGNRSVVTSLTFSPPGGGDGISIALWGIQLFVKSAENVNLISPTWGIFEKPPALQFNHIRLLENNTTSIPDDTIAAIPDPAVTASVGALRDDLVANTIEALRTNISDLTEQINSLRTIAKNYGLIKEFQVTELTGLTLYLDPHLSAHVKDGNNVEYAQNVINIGARFGNFFGTIETPSYLDGYINGNPVLAFDKSNEESLENTGSTWASYVTASEFVVLIVVQVDSMIGTGGSFPHQQDAILDGNAYFGLYMTSPDKINGQVYSGGFVYTTSTIPLGTPFLIEYRLDGGFVRTRINDGATNSASTGSIDSLANVPILGHGSSANPYLDGFVGPIIICNQYIPAEIEEAREFLREKYNLW